MFRSFLCFVAGAILLFLPGTALADDSHAGPLHVSVLSIFPFAVLLLSIALLPLIAGHFWHSNLRRFLVAAGLAIPVIAYLLYLEWVDHQPGLEKLEHAIFEYLDFILLLFSLYVVSGGIYVQGSFRPTPAVNTLFLAIGAVLANFIGTTGASMILIRPVLRINLARTRNGHIPIFFIFVVSNVGGLLTPLGDPPLFLGFLRGVDFFWTMSLWPQWLVVNGLVLAVFFAWDTFHWRREPVNGRFSEGGAPFAVRGLINIVFLLGILAGVLFQSPAIARSAASLLDGFEPENLLLVRPFTWILMGGIAALSILLTPRRVRESNDFSFEAIIEVAVLFLGIFVTMVPALQYLESNSAALGLTRPWQYFWCTGMLSSFLDNAPTYLTFGTIAAQGPNLASLTTTNPQLLAAISCGAVFMGANTYIGNGPNFMVKAIADGSGYRTPSFFGYFFYACMILMPIFLLVTFVFFRP